MLTVCISVDGNSDELDDVLRPLFSDQTYARAKGLSSYNSIQWGRVLIQMAHWIYGYFQVTKSNDKRITMAVPCGACGNMAGNSTNVKILLAMY